MARGIAKDGEFLIMDRTPDYEHQGDNEAHIQFIKDELKEANIDTSKLNFSWFTDYDDGEEGIVTIRGAKALEKRVRDAMPY